MVRLHPILSLLTPQLVVLILAAASCVANGLMAGRRNRNRLGWAFLGALLPVISSLTLLALGFICTRCRARLCSREVQDGVCFSCGKTLR